MNIKQNELIIYKENVPVLSEQVDKIIDELKEYKNNLDEIEKEFRATLLDSMIKNNIASGKTDKYTISQVIPKSKVLFNKDDFINNENKTIVDLFIKINQTETFDIEKFKLDCPEIYKKYLIVKEDISVDEKKLSKTFPEIYERYCIHEPSTGNITLRIVENKK